MARPGATGARPREGMTWPAHLARVEGSKVRRLVTVASAATTPRSEVYGDGPGALLSPLDLHGMRRHMWLAGPGTAATEAAFNRLHPLIKSSSPIIFGVCRDRDMGVQAVGGGFHQSMAYFWP